MKSRKEKKIIQLFNAVSCDLLDISRIKTKSFSSSNLYIYNIELVSADRQNIDNFNLVFECSEVNRIVLRSGLPNVDIIYFVLELSEGLKARIITSSICEQEVFKLINKILKLKKSRLVEKTAFVLALVWLGLEGIKDRIIWRIKEGF